MHFLRVWVAGLLSPRKIVPADDPATSTAYYGNRPCALSRIRRFLTAIIEFSETSDLNSELKTSCSVDYFWSFFATFPSLLLYLLGRINRQLDLLGLISGNMDLREEII